MAEDAGRRIVVTGAAGGIGRAIAARLAAGGDRVLVNDLDADALADVAADIGAVPYAGDAASADGAAQLVAAAREKLGGIDVWVGNAGVDRGRGLDASVGDWELSWNVNVMAHVRAAQELIPGWIAQGGGRYVVTASAAGLLTMLGAPAYSVTKHAVVAFAEWLSATYRHEGIVVQALCPQGVRTRMFDEMGELKPLLEHDPALEPEEVAESLWEALQGEEFLILPHPQVAKYYSARVASTDAWLGRMNKIQQAMVGA